MDAATRRSALQSLLIVSMLALPAAAQVDGHRVLWQIGKTDGDTAEFALAPNDALRFSSAFNQDPVFAVGISDPKKDWPYAQPGPADVWAGSKSHTFTVLFGIKRVSAQGECRLVADLVDTHPSLPPSLQIKVNGQVFEVALPKGAGPESIFGEPAKGRRHRFEVPVSASLLRAGPNSVDITTTSGNWMLYDALRLEVPEAVEPAELSGGTVIAEVTGTPLFPRTGADEPLRQNVTIRLCNPGPPAVIQMKGTIEGGPSWTEELGRIEHGVTLKTIRVPDASRPTELLLELYEAGKAAPGCSLRIPWQPGKKWKIYCVSYSHHDLGFGNYPHRLRTDIRHANIERPLQFCRETDSWDDDSKFRYVIETSEPITSFLGGHSAADAAELARRIREGRIQLGGIHNTANTEQLGVEELARLFYLSGRHTPDLLGVPVGKTAQIDDVVGLTWGLVTCCAEAGHPYFFHGYNSSAPSLQPAQNEPVFYWQGPDGKSKVLIRSFQYGGYGGDSLGDANEAAILKQIDNAVAAKWPYDLIMCQDGTDFQLITMENARKIRAWNARYSYPRLICATMDMFFNDISSQLDRAPAKTYAKDANNLWVDQDSSDAWLLAGARRQEEAIPTAEKFSTIASAMVGGGYPWLDIYQAYHRLLQYHEHTDGADQSVGTRQSAGARHYETELVENREMVAESEAFTAAALGHALERLTQAISTDTDKTLIVFNSLSWARTGPVRVAAGELKEPFELVDAVTGRETPHQMLVDGTVLFAATDVSAMGYKAFRVVPGAGQGSATKPAAASETELENRYYQVRFDPATGAIASIHDKELNVELVDAAAPYKFNEYLYQYYDSPAFDKVQWYRAEAAKLSTSVGPVASVMTVTAKARGVDRLEQQVVLYNDIKRIDFAMNLAKSPSGRTLVDYLQSTAKGKEAVYAALPLAVPGFQVHHETPGAVVEPIRQQFAGSCTAFYSVRHFADVSNSKYGVTLATLEAPLVEYDHPRPCAYEHHITEYESKLEYPARSHLYLYMMNNMFETNCRMDQQGPVSFHWSIRSHEGDWRKGAAARFGWEYSNPLIARLTKGIKQGPLPKDASSFVSVDVPNVVCTTIKPAESNGSGLVLRFNESDGVETKATVSLPFFGKIASANETNLVEDDRPVMPEVTQDSRISFTIAPFGIKTIRVLSKVDAPSPGVTAVKAAPVSDMEMALSWQVDAASSGRVDHYNVYRGASADFKPTLLGLVGRPAGTKWTDSPQLNYGGWINNRLEPDTTYYYRISAVDRWNNEGPPSEAIQAKTLKSNEKNAVPLRVEGLRVVLVSDCAPYNYFNLLWRTNCESDVRQYRIHRGTQPGFSPDDSNKIGVVDADEVVKGSTDYGHTPIDRRLREFDHMMFADETVQPGTTYYYKVCAVDAAGQAGPFSVEASGRTKPKGP